MTSPYRGILHLMDMFNQLSKDVDRALFFEKRPTLAKTLRLPLIKLDDERRAFIHEHPVILSLSVLAVLMQIPGFKEALLPLLAEFGIDNLGDGNVINLRTHPGRYPVGRGPLESLWQDVFPDSFPQVLAQAAASDLASRLSPMYVTALGGDCERLAEREPLLAAMRQRLVAEAVNALDASSALVNEDEAAKMSRWAEESWQRVRAALRRAIGGGLVAPDQMQFAERLCPMPQDQVAQPTALSARRVPRLSSQEPQVPGIEDEERQCVSKWLTTLDGVIESSGEVELDAKDPLRCYRTLRAKIGRAESLGVVTALAALCLVAQDEAAGLQILDDAWEGVQSVDPVVMPGLTYLRAMLASNLAVDRVNAGDAAGAMSHYTRALGDLCHLGLRAHVLQHLHRITDLSRKPDRELVVHLFQGLHRVVLDLELKFGGDVMEVVQAALSAATDGLLTAGVNRELLFPLWQLSKGMRFATALSAGLAELRHMDGVAWRGLANLLYKVRVAEHEEGAVAEYLSGTEFLLAYAATSQGTNERRSGSAALRQEYDQTLERLLVHAATGTRELPFHEVPWLSLPQVQNLLGPRTVLAVFFLGSSASGCVSVTTMLLTSEDVTVHRMLLKNIPDVRLRFSDGLLHPLAPFVESVRDATDSEPTAGAAAREDALHQLSESGPLLFGDLSVLSRLRSRGKDHLCIVPHGPLHYFPFHLIGEAGRPLADAWVVTYLPNLYLLVSNERRPKSIFDRADCVAAFAASRFAGEDEEMPEAVDEARVIAAIFGREPMVDEDFQRDNVIAHLTSGCRYIHIASHGDIDPAAPCFHRFLMGLNQSQNDALAAHELLPYDLRGVDLLTLSACETALGRFDIGDNLRGLPAFFFLAGVSTLVGTLWPVGSEASRTFFISLYRELKLGKSKLDAFAVAQRHTRQVHPEYRDWGAFCYLGEWAECRHSIGQQADRSIPGIPYIRIRDVDPRTKRGG